MNTDVLNSEQKLRFPYLLCETKADDTILYANNSYLEMIGYSKNDFIGKNHSIVFHPDMPKIYLDEAWKSFKIKGFWTGHIKKVHKDGKQFFWAYVTILTKTSASGEVLFTFINTPPIAEELKKFKEEYGIQ
ncbi:PAS domain-containing protein [Sulfurimonas sp. SAG-AH-194-L11]|nr:PAS domain-containing protein [Sulfurimonas sp. SAG-AH-194-L11]MDF1877696.1 PAS domain-containing protein [Sulfurimonas sp. SAG-AH-194-L11]